MGKGDEEGLDWGRDTLKRGIELVQGVIEKEGGEAMMRLLVSRQIYSLCRSRSKCGLRKK